MLKRFLAAGSLPQVERYLRWVSVFDTQAKRDLYSDDFRHERSVSTLRFARAVVRAGPTEQALSMRRC